MGPLIIIIMSCSAGLMISTIASAGIYYVYKNKKLQERRDMRPITSSTPAHAYDDSYLEESVMDLEAVPVQPETRRPIKSTMDVYPPIKDEDPDHMLLQSLDMIDCSPGAMPSDDTIEKRGYLEITLHYYQLSSTLTVTLIRMGDLPIRDTGYPPDVLVEMQIKYAYDDKIKSEIYRCSCNPHMFESFRFEISLNDLGNQTLLFKVIDMMETNLPPPPTPPEMPKSRWGKTPEPPPPPPPPSPTQIGVSTVPLVSVAMKKLMADTEITIVRDIIKIKKKPVMVSASCSTGPETAVSTATEYFEESIFESPEVTEEEKEPEEFETTAELDLETLPISPALGSFRLDDEPPLLGSSLLVSLAYWKPSEKLTVVVLKAKNLTLTDQTKTPDPFVKLCVKMGDKKLKKKRTVVKRGNRNPVWNEAFSFAVPHRILHRVSLHCSVKHHSERGKERTLGVVILSSKSSEEDAVDHWNAMTASRKSVAKWHTLEQERTLSRRSSKASLKAAKEARKSKAKGTKSTKEIQKVPEGALPQESTEGQSEDAPPGPEEGAEQSTEIASQPEPPPQTE